MDAAGARDVADEHPLDARGLSRRRRRGRPARLLRHGVFILALSAAPALPARAQADDAATSPLVAEWVAEYKRIAPGLEDEDPARAAQARAQLHGLYESIAATVRYEAVILYYRAKELGESEALTTDLDERLRLLTEAAQAVAFHGNQDSAAGTEHLRAKLLAQAGRHAEAREVLSKALLLYPDAKLQRPGLLVTLADLTRRAGEFERALELASELEASTDEGAPARRRAPAGCDGRFRSMRCGAG